MLPYRAVQFVWRVGTAPAIIDFLLILATGVLLFIATLMILLPFHNAAPKSLLIIAFVAIIAALGIWYWSNHFHHRRPLAMEEMTDAERQQIDRDRR